MIYLITTFSGVEQHIAQGTNLLFFIPTSLVAIIINMKNKNIEKETAIIVAISGIFGTIIGSNISLKVDVVILRKYFGIFLIIMSFFEIYSILKSYIKNKKVDNKNI